MAHFVGLVFVAGILAGQPTGDSGRWVEVGRYEDRRVHIDSQTLRRNGSQVVYWVRHIFNDVQPDGTVEARYEEDIDCAARSIGPRAYVMRDRNGEIFDSGVFPPDARVNGRQPIDPGTMREAIFEALCEGRM